jgi:hypothetical protein
MQPSPQPQGHPAIAGHQQAQAALPAQPRQGGQRLGRHAARHHRRAARQPRRRRHWVRQAKRVAQQP